MAGVDGPTPATPSVQAALDKLGAPAKRVAMAPRDLHCLAMEGGGGKGLAYLGALEALEELNALKQLKLVAGASAGAITALLLSLGMTAADIRQYLANADFDSFYDPPKPRTRPRIGAQYTQVLVDSPQEQTMRKYLGYGTSIEILIGLFLKVPWLRLWWGLAFGDETLPQLAQRLNAPRADLANSQPGKVLIENLRDYLTYLPVDMGLFSGQAARTEFDKIIRQAIRKKRPSMSKDDLDKRPNISFRDLETLLPDCPRLVLTGSNVSTGKTQLFSHIYTPDFPVADAVRISMSLPFLYKPYVITQSRGDKWPPCGTYVDGGWWNNIPYRDTGYPMANTLTLRLEIEPPTRVAKVGDLLKKVASQGFFGTGESQVMDAYGANVIMLDVRPLSLVKFKADKKDLDTVTHRSRRRVFYAFGRVPPRDDWDWNDDKQSSDLSAQNPACEFGSLSSDAWSSD